MDWEQSISYRNVGENLWVSITKKFSGKYSHRIINGGIGHHLPEEAP